MQAREATYLRAYVGPLHAIFKPSLSVRRRKTIRAMSAHGSSSHLLKFLYTYSIHAALRDAISDKILEVANR